MPRRTFDQIYSAVSPAWRERLLNFRSSHPLRQLTTANNVWKYIACGEGEQTVLILPGGMGTAESSFATIERLESRYKVISPSNPPISNTGELLDGLVAILDSERVPAAHLLGHSLGAALAHYFIRRHPGRVDRMAIDGFGLYTGGHVRAVKVFTAVMGLLPYRWGLRAYYGNAMRRLTAGSQGDEEGTFWAAYVEELFEYQFNKETGMAMLRLLLDLSQYAEEYGAFQPVERPENILLLLARDDRGFTQVERDRLVATYPRARLVEFETGGHLVGYTHRAEYNAAVDRFLAGEQESRVSQAPGA